MPETPAPAPHAPAAESGWKISYLAVKLGDVVMRQADAALAPLGLKPREYNVMTCIGGGLGGPDGDLSQQDLSRTLGLYAPGLVGLLDGLQARGVVTRARSLTDRRRHVVKLTADGARLLAQANAAVADLEDRLFAGLADGERASLRALLGKALAGWE